MCSGRNPDGRRLRPLSAPLGHNFKIGPAGVQFEAGNLQKPHPSGMSLYSLLSYLYLFSFTHSRPALLEILTF